MLDQLEIAARIEAEYQKRGYNLGWRLLCSPWEVVEGAEVAFIGLQPGGSVEPLDHATLCMSAGSAYEQEAWGYNAPGQAPLQLEILSVFQKLNVQPDSVLAGNLIPFRAPTADKFSGMVDAIAFGEKIWTDILRNAKPRVVIAMGEIAASAMCRIGRIAPERLEKHYLEWGKVSARTGRGDFDLIWLPHLSRFRIMRREKSQAAVDGVFSMYEQVSSA